MHPSLKALPTEPRARLAALFDLAKGLRAKGVDNLTDSELDLVDELKADLDKTERRVKSADAMAAFGRGPNQPGWTSWDGSTSPVLDTATPAGYRKSAAAPFAKAISGALAQDRSDGDGMTRKALVPGGLVGFAFDGAPVTGLPQAPLTVANLCRTVPVTVPNGRDLQQTGRNANVGTVPLGGQKPFSSFDTAAADWKIATLATLVGPIAKQNLQDLPGILDLLGEEVAYAVAARLDAYLLTGGTAEDGTTVTGILNTPGVATQAFVPGDPLLTLRTAIGSLQSAGIAPNGVLMHPDQWTALSTIKDKSDRYILDAAPAEAVVQRLWGLPVVLSNGVPNGQAVVADFSRVRLLTRGAYEAVMFEQGQGTPESGTGASRVPATDLAQTNSVLLRAEGRFGVFLESLPSIRKVALAA